MEQDATIGERENSVHYFNSFFLSIIGGGPKTMKSFRSVVVFFIALAATMMFFSSLSSSQQDEEIETFPRKINQLIEQCKYRQAIPLAIKLLEASEKRYSPTDVALASALYNLAELYRMIGSYTEAEPLFIRSLKIWEKTYGPDHAEVARSVSTLAELYRMMGRYAEAKTLCGRALEIREKVFGSNHFEVAQSLNNLAEIYRMTGYYAEAESLYARSLVIRENTFGPDHPEVAQSINNIADLYWKVGNYAEAEFLFKRALDIREKTLGRQHLDFGQSLNNLAVLYCSTGRYTEAEIFYEESLAVSENIFGKESPRVTQLLNNLALVYANTGRYGEAESLYKRTLKIRENALGPDHSEVAQSLHNMASLYVKTNRYAEAEPLFIRSLKIWEKALGPDHPDVALSFQSLAELYSNMSRHAEAYPLYKRSLAIYVNTFGDEHPDVSLCLRNLGSYYGMVGNHSAAHSLLKKSVSIQDSIRESTFAVLTETQKLSFMKTQEKAMYELLSHTFAFLGNDQAVLVDTFNAWLKWKGSVVEAQKNYLDALLASDDPNIKQKLKELDDAKREAAKFQLSGSREMTLQEYKTKLARLRKKTEFLETEVMTMNKDFKLEKKTQEADAKTFIAIIPEHAAYLDYVKIEPYDFKKRTWGVSRYLLFFFTPDDTLKLRLIDIGESEKVDRHIKVYLKEMAKAKTEGNVPDEKKLRKEASLLYGLLIKPVEPFLNRKTNLFISPDGSLNLIPFEVLISPSDTYLIEEFIISYVGAGRDVVKFKQSSLAGGGVALIIADPDYDLGQKEIEQAKNSAGVRLAHIRGPVSRDVKHMHFNRLPETKNEADKIEKILKDKFGQRVNNYQNKKALEDLLFNTSSPKILHLATHGFFLAQEETKDILKMQNILVSDDATETLSVTIENPMLRSGIVLAGVNASLKEGRDEGVVTAEKILGLKLKGTDLVVLSACETGIGDIQSGEGVFGLKRAFIFSGAKSLVMSLWSIPSEQTVDLMTSFYTFLSEGKTRSEALRQAKLAIMKQNTNPFFWGAFTITGSP